MQNNWWEHSKMWVDDTVEMNSVELQRIFYETYQNFFHSHNIVLSGDSILTWWTDISHGVSVLRLKQKLPMKTFCGVKFNTSGKVTFGTIFVYDILNNSFKESPFRSISKYDVENISAFLENFLQWNNYVWWFEIDFLTEAPPGHGFAFSSVISVLLTFLIYSVTKKLDLHTLVQKEIPEDHPLFEELYAFSLELSHCISQGKSIGGGSNYAVMVRNISCPIVYISEKNTLNYASNVIIENDSLPDNTLPIIDKILYKGNILDFLWIEVPSIWELPLDYGILFTGLGYRFSDIESTRDNERSTEERLSSFVNDSIKSLPSLQNEENATIWKLLNFDKNEAIYRNIDIMNLRILEWLCALYKNTDNGDTSDIFISMIQKIGLSSFSYQKTNKLFFALQYHFHQLQQFEDESIGIIPFNTAQMGGSLLFVMKKEKSRVTFQKVMEQLRNDGHIVALTHASWRDGYSSDWIRLEQYIDEKIYSPYTRSGDVFYKDSLGRAYCGEYEAILKNETDSILLDTIAGRVYIKGTKLTSKDIHSQNTTIDMFRLLLENMWQEIANSKLPISTYSQNKNEILSKVILPIKKIVKEYFSIDLSLTCSWGITEYYMRLDKDEWIPIWIIQVLKD